MITLNSLQKKHPVAVALSITSIGTHQDRQPIAIALQIFETQTGRTQAKYYSLIKVNKEIFEKISKNISWKKFSRDAKSLDDISDQIQSQFIHHQLYKKNACILCFDVKKNRRTIQLFSNITLPEVKTSYFKHIQNRQIAPSLSQKTHYKLRIIEMGFFNVLGIKRSYMHYVPGFYRQIREKRFPLSRSQYLNQYQMVPESRASSSKEFAKEIHKVFKKIIQIQN